MLRPQESPTRDRRSLSGLWRFAPTRTAWNASRSGSPRRWRPRPTCPCRPATTTSSPDGELHDHVGEVWYQTRVRVPHTWADQRIVLRFDSATHRAIVWVDGTSRRTTRAATRRSRPTSPTRARRARRCCSRPPSTTSSPGNRSRRASCDERRRQPPAVLARLLQLRGPAPPGVAVHDAATHLETSRRHRPATARTGSRRATG